uniref:Uncharacterized protein n=1 Tax=Meloidogyne enterolobii TaxID=390850 RepID=A0A6V7V663_MELEN|nr:unnamed protein product [Meloidogyne enterolobii]
MLISLSIFPAMIYFLLPTLSTCPSTSEGSHTINVITETASEETSILSLLTVEEREICENLKIFDAAQESSITTPSILVKEFLIGSLTPYEVLYRS